MALGGGRNGLGNGPFRIDHRLRFTPNSIEVRDAFLPLLLKRFEFGLLQVRGDRKLGLVVVAIGICGLVEDCVELVIVLDGDRIVLVRMALGTPHRQSHPNLQRRIDTVFHGRDSELLIIGSPFVIAQGRAMKSRRDTLSHRGTFKQISGELFDGELIVRHIVVERMDHPIAIGPKIPCQILLVPFGIGVASQIEPQAAPMLAETWMDEQLLDHAFDRSIAIELVFSDKSLDPRSLRMQADEVEPKTPDQRVRIRTWGWR